MSTQTPTGLTPATTRQVVGLVARREISTRLKTKAFRIATLVIVIIVVGIAVVSKLVGGSTTTLDVGVTPATANLGTQLVATASAVHTTVKIQPVADEATGRDEVRKGKLDGLLVGDGNSVQVVVKQDVNGDLNTALQALASTVAFDQRIAALGGDPSQVSSAVAAAKVNVQQLSPQPKGHSQQLVLGIVAAIL